jgi:predicted DNA-binding transcriptional regulator AlpA
MIKGDDEILLNTMDAANLLGVSYWFLINDRRTKRRVPFVTIGERSYRYRLSDIKEYIRSRSSHQPVAGAVEA